MPKISKEVSAWFEMPDDPYGGRVHVRLLKKAEVDVIFEKSREIKTTYVKEFRQTETAVRIYGAKVEVAVAAIKDWEKFLDEHDQPLKCTPANIRIMCLEDGFTDFIDRCLAELEKQQAEKQQAEAKN